MLRVNPCLKARARTTAVAAQPDRLFIEDIGRSGHAAVQGVAYLGAGLARRQGNLHRLCKCSALRRNARRREHHGSRHAVDPLTQQVHAFLIDGFARQRRHADIIDGVDAHVGNRAPDVVWRNDPRPIDALIDQHRPIDERLFVERRVIARIEIGDGAARTMTLRAICIEIRARAILQRSRGVVGRRRARQTLAALHP